MVILDNASKSFGEHILFKNICLEIPDGELVAFTGASGSGKTTLLNIIGGLEPLSEGTVKVDGTDISDRKNLTEYLRNRVGFLFQNFALVENKTVRENIELVRTNNRSDITIEQALEKAGIPEKADAKVYTLSGGEQQRAALARLMVKKCDIILADEPTGSLDKTNALAVLRILRAMNKEQHKTVIIVTHDPKIAEQCDRIIEISDGEIVG